MGRKAAGAEALAWTLDEGHDVVGVLTDSHLTGSPTASLARKKGLRLYTYESAAEAIASSELIFDLGVSFVYWRILKEPFLSHPSSGIINFHPAPLPEYKGTGGYNVAILDALDTWAVSAHYIDAGIDTGSIIDRSEFPIDPEMETARSLEAISIEHLLVQYKKVISRVADEGRLPSKPNEGGRYISRAEMEAMKRVVPGDDVDRKIRAFWFPPYQGAYVEVNGKPYTLVNDYVLGSLVDGDVTHLHRAPAERSKG